MKTTSHSLMAKGIMVLLSLLILVFIFTYSWYLSPETPATASGLSVSTSSAVEFDIALGFITTDTGHYVVSEFNDDFDFTSLRVFPSFTIGPAGNTQTVSNGIQSTTYYDLLKYFSPVDLTGNGATLARPYMNPKNEGINTSELSVSHDISDNVEYISFDIIVRSNAKNYKISMIDGSYVISAAEAYPYQEDTVEGNSLTAAINNDTTKSALSVDNIDPTKLNTATTSSPLVRKSNYGTFSEDSVVGAVRIAMSQYNALTNDTYTADQFFGRSQPVNNVEDEDNLVPSNTSRRSSVPELLWIPRNDIFLQTLYAKNSSNEGYEVSENWTLYDSGDAQWDNSSNTVVDARDYFDPVIADADIDSIEDKLVNRLHGLKYSEAASKHIYYDETKIVVPNSDPPTGTAVSTRYTEVNGVVAGQNLTSSNKVIIQPIYTDGEYYYGKCHVNLWIEGCDAEARRAIDGGLFFFGLKLQSTI